uniref:Uncharacterized protein n=1 Tax=Solanum lycopersicum TaxID=4081 RepID=A0A3Q7IUZ9_SOLLC
MSNVLGYPNLLWQDSLSTHSRKRNRIVEQSIVVFLNLVSVGYSTHNPRRKPGATTTHTNQQPNQEKTNESFASIRSKLSHFPKVMHDNFYHMHQIEKYDHLEFPRVEPCTFIDKFSTSSKLIKRL